MVRTKRGFGQIQRLPSKRYRARYTGPDTALHNAPRTFDTREDAEAWLAAERRLISRDEWTPPKARGRKPEALTFETYARGWLDRRTDGRLGKQPMRPRTRYDYELALDRLIIPTFGDLAVVAIDAPQVIAWHEAACPGKPSMRAHAYSLLRTIFEAAIADSIIAVNPCRIRGAGNAKRARRIEPLTMDELTALVAAMPAGEYRVMTIIAAWCALRFGELTELRRDDVDLDAGVVKVRRAVTHVRGEAIVGPPKSDAGIRDVAIPPHIVPMIREYLASVVTGRKGLLFPGPDGRHLTQPMVRERFYRARAAIGRPDIRWHDLRHFGATLAAQSGATLAELMARLGHSTPTAALVYQHAAKNRAATVAARMSKMAGASR